MAGDWTTIGAIAQVFDGPHATPKKIDEGPYFLSISSLENGKLDLSKSARVSEEQFKKWTKRVTPRQGDVLFSYETRLGEAALMPSGITACLGRRMGLLRPDTSKVDPRFLLFAYLGPAFQQEIRTRTNYGATVERIALKELPDFPIQIPSLPEQKAIAHILGTLDEKIELNHQMNAMLESMAQALFKSWFVDFDPVIDNALAEGNPIPEPLQARAEARKALGDQYKPLPEAIQKQFPNRFVFNEDMGWVPEGWEETAIKSIATVVKGKSYKSAELADSETALVTLKSFKRGGGYRLDGLKEYTGAFKPEQEVFPGELVIAYTDVTQAADVIGKPAMIASDNRYKHLVISLDVAVVRPHTDSHKFFLYGVAQTHRFQQHTRSHSTGTTVLHLHKDAIPNFMVPLPCSAILEEYAKLVTSLYSSIDMNIVENRNLSALRDTLLPKLLSDQLRIPDAEKQVAEAI